MTEIEDTLTLMDIIDRTEEWGDCLLWNSYFRKTNQPKFRGKMVRRMVWEAQNGPIPEGMFASTKCNSPRCVSCLKLTTKAEITKKAMANPATRLKRRASGARANRNRFGKITMDIAREIIATKETKQGKVWAKELGTSCALVSHVRCGRSWVEHQGNPFAGLMR